MFIQVHCKYCKIPELIPCGFIRRAWNHCTAELYKQVEISVFLPTVPSILWLNMEKNDEISSYIYSEQWEFQYLSCDITTE